MEDIAVAAVIVSTAVSVVTLCLVILLLRKREEAFRKDPPETNYSLDFEEWASNAGLTLDTVRVLKEEGFTSMKLLRYVTSDPVTENLLKNKLPLAQRAALTGAITKLRGDSVVKHSAIKVVEKNNIEVVRSPHDKITGSLNNEGETLTLLMVGKTGTGKSTTGNTILGGEFFQSSPAFTSVTTVCELRRATRNGVTIEIMDCPNFFDTNKSDESIATNIVKSVGGMHRGPHAVLLFLGIVRFTEEEENTFTRLTALFDERLAKYTIVVFTGGDAIRPTDSFKEMIAANRKLQSILTACDNRYVIFNNMASDKEPQVDILLQKVRDMMAKNGGEPYTCPKYFKITEAIEEEVKKRMTKVEIEILKRKNYVKELETKAKQAKEELDRERKEIQEREKTQKQKAREEEKKLREQVENLKPQLEHMKTTEAWQTSYYSDPSSSQTLRFFLMGKAGAGKSATGNTILEEPLFDTDLCFSSVTRSCFYKSRKRNGFTIEITDSPGLCDTKTLEEDTAGKVVQAVVCMNPGPTAFLYVIGIGRYTEEDEGVYKRIKSLFDDRVTGYTIIIFTRGDQLKRQKKTIKDVLSSAPDSLRKALVECDNRYLVFDNMADDKQPQVRSLLQLVRNMSEKNGWKPYTCPKYKEVGEQMNQEVARRLRKVQEEEMKRKKYVQELEEKARLAEEKAAQEKKAFERKEAEREERMKKAEEEREERMAALQEMINEQKLSAEKQKEEERKVHEEREQMMKKLEKERNDELQRIEKQMKETNQLLKDKEAAMKAEREAHRKLMEAKERVEQKIKTEVAEQSVSSCIIL